nr:hypothetical protein GCM10020241_02550 [Streptoalloteichus tenebrarius]
MWHGVTCRNDRGRGRGVDNRFWRTTARCFPRSWRESCSGAPVRADPPPGASRVIADNGCSRRAIRSSLRRRRIPATIPEGRDQQATGCAAAGQGAPTGLRPHCLPTPHCRRRLRQPSHAVSCLVTRFDDKTAISYQGVIDLATLLIWL